MAFQHKPNSGSLFPNDKKEKDSQPDMKGSALINGVEYWLAAWGDNQRMSLKLERKDEKKESKPADKKVDYQAPLDDIDSGEIPF